MTENHMKAVLFDLDGTLTDTIDDIADAMNLALRKSGLPEHPTDAYKYMVGNGARKLAERAVGDRQDLAQSVLDAYQKQYETHNAVKTHAYPGITELLNALADKGIKICVLSNKPDADTQNVVRHYFPTVRFDAIWGQVDSVPVKPDPTGAIMIADRLGIAPSDFAYLGDTYVDMTCARNAGMHPFGVLWGFRTAQELTESGAEVLLGNPLDLLGYI